MLNFIDKWLNSQKPLEGGENNGQGISQFISYVKEKVDYTFISILRLTVFIFSFLIEDTAIDHYKMK